MTPLYPQKLALTSPTGSGRSVGIVRSRTKATEFGESLCVVFVSTVPRRSWEDNIKMNHQEVGCGGMDWIELVQNRYKWRALVNAVMNLRVP